MIGKKIILIVNLNYNQLLHIIIVVKISLPKDKPLYDGFFNFSSTLKKKKLPFFLEKEDKSKERRNGRSNRRRCQHSDRNGRL